jgi:hypothetical protein
LERLVDSEEKEKEKDENSTNNKNPRINLFIKKVRN